MLTKKLCHKFKNKEKNQSFRRKPWKTGKPSEKVSFFGFDKNVAPTSSY